jgi:signal transduction histidine kinase
VNIGAFYRQILEILTTPPGNLVYHLVLSFSIAGASLSAFSHGRQAGSSSPRRAIVGLSLLLLAQFTLMLNAALAQYFENAAALLPVLDRSVAAMSLVLIVWIWAFPEPFRLADAATVLLALLVLALAALNWIWWANQPPIDLFNGTPMDQLWVIFSLFLAVYGGLLLLIRRPPGFGAGMGMFALFFLGQLLHLLAPLPPGDYPGAIRLAQLAAYPFLLALPQRFPAPATRSALQPITMIEQPRPVRFDPQVLQAFLTLSASNSWPEVCQAATVAAAYTVRAAYTLLLRPPDPEGRVPVECGYDLIHSQPVSILALESQSFPLLSNALTLGRPLRLNRNSTAPELAQAMPMFDLAQPAPLLFVPVHGSSELTVLGILLLSPLDAPGWSTQDLAQMVSYSQSLSGVLRRFQQMVHLEEQLSRMRLERESEEAKKKEIVRNHESLIAQLQDLQAEASQERARAESLAALVSGQEGIQKGAQEAISRLQVENERLARLVQARPAQLPPARQEAEALRGELRIVLEEVARLRSEVPSNGVTSSMDEHSPAAAAIPEDKAEAIASISQELRQPLASILGYTDLLLSESVGILGALQRKFLERVKASAERLGGLLDALVRAVLEASQVEVGPHPVDLRAVIMQAMADSLALISNKDIRVQLDMSDRLPAVYGDWDALHQAIFHLLQNAGSATPAGGKVVIRAQEEGGEINKNYILVQVTDEGGGISPQEQVRIFSQLYRSGHAPIKGAGENSIGLSIVKTLVEAQGGRIWLESRVGEGTTFSMLLPASFNTDLGM